jgi:hypothetical protein
MFTLSPWSFTKESESKNSNQDKAELVYWGNLKSLTNLV